MRYPLGTTGRTERQAVELANDRTAATTPGPPACTTVGLRRVAGLHLRDDQETKMCTKDGLLLSLTQKQARHPGRSPIPLPRNHQFNGMR